LAKSIIEHCVKIFSRIALPLVLLLCDVAIAQDLEPRRWSQLPTGVNFLGVGIGASKGDIYIDPVMKIEDVDFDLALGAAAYIRSFGLFGKSARFDVRVPYVAGNWQGLVDGEFARVHRSGFGDPRFRLSMLLYGARAETPQEFARSEKSNTVVGAAIAVTAPLGEYYPDKLINLGANRWVIRPQVGVTHTRGNWAYELTGSIFLYSDNDDFYNNTELKNDPLYALQGHLIYTFRPGLWASLSTAYGTGASPTIIGVGKDVETTNWLSALSVGLPLSPRQGINMTYLRTRTQESTGADTNTLVVSYSQMF
jgi:hypothetical protein